MISFEQSEKEDAHIYRETTEENISLSTLSQASDLWIDSKKGSRKPSFSYPEGTLSSRSQAIDNGLAILIFLSDKSSFTQVL